MAINFEEKKIINKVQNSNFLFLTNKMTSFDEKKYVKRIILIKIK